jgi:hypothetical protein
MLLSEVHTQTAHSSGEAYCAIVHQIACVGNKFLTTHPADIESAWVGTYTLSGDRAQGHTRRPEAGCSRTVASPSPGSWLFSQDVQLRRGPWEALRREAGTSAARKVR